jgi:hypothetical protein
MHAPAPEACQSGELAGHALSARSALRVVKRRAAAAGIRRDLGCHSCRATGITAYLVHGGTLERAAAIAPAPESHEPAARIAAVLEEVRPELARILARYRIPPRAGDDLVQDALVALLLKWPHVHHPAGWLLVTLRDLCLD